MGRRKIEIKAIKDDRNRSVTFLKRKGGLFKKAHELSVLCSVDVAVIIFGHNKKLHEFSSGDIAEIIARYQYYGGAHEHKGPEDFSGKKATDDDEDEDMASPPPGSQSPPPSHPMITQLHQHAGYQHMNQQASSASPPLSNRVPFHPRRGTPQPQQISRPPSREAARRASSNRISQPPPHVSQAPPTQNGYAYMPNGSMYHNQPVPGMAGQTMAGQQPPYPPHHAQSSSVPKNHPAYLQDQRRQSVPLTYPPERHGSAPELPPPQVQHAVEQQILTQPRRTSAKSHSIYTPIEENHSMLAQHFRSTTAEHPSRNEPPVKIEPPSQPQPMDIRSVPRSIMPKDPSPPPPRPMKPLVHTPRNSSVSSIHDIPPPPRSNSAQFSVSGGSKRPKLKVHIPEEQSDHGSATAESSPHGSAGTAGGMPSTKGPREGSHSSGVLLPAPSPSAPASASALPSAGAQGPPNPFARPSQPGSNAPSNSIETPISALPSRFINDNLLPSPSSFFIDYNYPRGGGEPHTLLSPITYQTPIAVGGPSFLSRDDGSGKRKSPEMDASDGATTKKLKT